MGMDVYGIEPTSEIGKYFRNNVWWWRPLWAYCEQVCPEQTSKVKYGQSNDGGGLKNQKDCTSLAKSLIQSVANEIPYEPPDSLTRIDDKGLPYYHFSYENVLEFCAFLLTCGGFKIQ